MGIDVRHSLITTVPPTTAAPILPPRTNAIGILGIPISVITMKSAVAQIAAWIAAGERKSICVADVHSVMQAQRDEVHREALLGADMVTPDGIPLVWVAKVRGASSMTRVCGADLMAAVCEASLERGWRHYFYGCTDEVLSALVRRLAMNYPGLKVVGTFSPPFRALSPEEDAEIVLGINKCAPDIVWVSLGCPKQEKWMAAHRAQICGTMIGVGAAFLFQSGQAKRAPVWSQKIGLEWAHRLLSEPKRVWRRYLIYAPLFTILVFAELVCGRQQLIARPERITSLD
jgi:N-acetylglucosaminyldiphosphoundecaprenol N-acetyl-beta-D-mannosaminyltransferase